MPSGGLGLPAHPHGLRPGGIFRLPELKVSKLHQPLKAWKERHPLPSVGEEDLFLATAGPGYCGFRLLRPPGLGTQSWTATSGSAAELRTRLYAHYEVQPPLRRCHQPGIITIQSADRTEYISAEGEGNSFIRLSGRVSVLLVDSDSGEKLSIEADELLVNRDASILSARGDISFERTRPDGKDYFFGQAMELDMDDWAGVFLDGRSVGVTARPTDGIQGQGHNPPGRQCPDLR
jgi:hypothetical protein